MVKQRVAADELVKKHPNDQLDAIYDRQEPNVAAPIFLVIRFFQRLKLYIDHGEFVWWWTASFATQLMPVTK